jgi:two-component system, cell cycle sensor histidine kinase and response regulator CckA
MSFEPAVLLVDDEEAVRETVSEYLRECGLNVITAGNAVEAMLKASDTDAQIAVLVTDFVMPDMTGIELSTHLAEAIPNLKTLVMTGFGNNVVVNGELATNGTQWLSKPVSLRVLEAEIRKMLGSASSGSSPVSRSESIQVPS